MSNISKIAIDIKSYKLLRKLLRENHKFKEILDKSQNEKEFENQLRQWVLSEMADRKYAIDYYKRNISGREAFNKLNWKDLASIRILDNLDNTGREIEDLNLRGQKITNQPFGLIWNAYKHGKGGATYDFFEDILYLFRQFTSNTEPALPKKDNLLKWMKRYPSGCNAKVIKTRAENKNRIIKILVDKISDESIKSRVYYFEDGLSHDQKIEKVNEWWNEYKFHLKCAIRNPELLNEMLDYSLSDEVMENLRDAQKAGIPFFVNPYYLSLLDVKINDFAVGADTAIRDYVIYSRNLINEFGNIVAWEKEDVVEPGKPNAAGWLLPTRHNLHRRYPEVAILIPNTVGRACGGLCVSCQRMYEFQSGRLNFDLKELAPKETWTEKLKKLLLYYENDSQLRDILITGGDALMSSDKSLKIILNDVYEMALSKKEANKNRKEGEKYAEMIRVRLGTRLPVYIPQRVEDKLVGVLAEFKEKASAIGIKQFVIQTHFESPMEVTPEAKLAIEKLTLAGWIVTNQLVYSVAASRRGHTAKLRKVLNDCGVITYYTFSVKGYRENSHNFATNARAMQEQLEEKVFGKIPDEYLQNIHELPEDAINLKENINKIRNEASLPFLATDRNVLNLPGVGKSLTFRTIGLTTDGRRILEFDHDTNRTHSPIIHKMGKVVIVESKSMSEYLRQLDSIGENINEYIDVFGYCIGETEPLMPIFKYPDYKFEITKEMTNLDIGENINFS